MLQMTVTDPHGGAVQSSIGRQASAQDASEKLKLGSRCYAVLSCVEDPGFSSLDLKTFFALCRLHGLSFDLKDQQGVVFSLFDTLASGCLGMTGVGATRHNAVEKLQAVTAFLLKQLRVATPQTKHQVLSLQQLGDCLSRAATRLGTI